MNKNPKQNQTPEKQTKISVSKILYFQTLFRLLSCFLISSYLWMRLNLYMLPFLTGLGSRLHNSSHRELGGIFLCACFYILFFFCLLTFHKCFLKQNIHELWELRHPIANILKHSTVRNIQAVHLCLLKSSEFRLWLVVSLKKNRRGGSWDVFWKAWLENMKTQVGLV